MTFCSFANIFKWPRTITGIHIWPCTITDIRFLTWWDYRGSDMTFCFFAQIYKCPCKITGIHIWHCAVTGIQLWPCAITRIPLRPCEIIGIHIFPLVFLPRFLNETLQLQEFIHDLLCFRRDFKVKLYTYRDSYMTFVLLLRFFLKTFIWLPRFLFDLVRLQVLIYDNTIHIRLLYVIVRLKEFI